MKKQITWILEQEVFSDNHNRLIKAIEIANHELIIWDDSWLAKKSLPSLDDQSVIFHGSLNNAHLAASNPLWKPGAFCNTDAFNCDSWYNNAKDYLLHDRWIECTVSQLVDDPETYLNQINISGSFFVRPNSPLKPFSGRVLTLDQLSLSALDHGFYYEDKDLPVIVTPVVNVGKEWRFVITDNIPITGSSYEATNRSESEDEIPQDVWDYANIIAGKLSSPDPVYILDVCESEGQLKLLELNPFSGADLYNCDRDKIVSAVEKVLL